MIADLLTKPLQAVKLSFLSKDIVIVDMRLLNSTENDVEQGPDGCVGNIDNFILVLCIDCA